MNGNTDSRSLSSPDPAEKEGFETQSSLMKNEEGDEKKSEDLEYSPEAESSGLEEEGEEKNDNLEYYSPEAKRLGLVEQSNEDQDFSTDEKSLGERVRTELRTRLGRVGDEVFDEDNSAEVQILEEEEVMRGTRGLGGLWKLSLCVTLSLATYILLSGPRIEPKWIPNFTERDPVPKIYRPRSRSSSSSAPST